MSITAGDLCAAHLGEAVTLTAPDVGDVTGEVIRVQHNAAGTDPLGSPAPAVTLVVLSTWSGALDPTHPITVETGA